LAVLKVQGWLAVPGMVAALAGAASAATPAVIPATAAAAAAAALSVRREGRRFVLSVDVLGRGLGGR
jgi:TctA family transporter